MCRWDLSTRPPHACGDVINWGDVPTWLAFVAATAAGVGAFLILRVERGRDRDAERATLRRQAELVSGWVAPDGVAWTAMHVDNASYLEPVDLAQLLLATKLITVNRSDQPVRDVHLLVGRDASWCQLRLIPVLPPDSEYPYHLDSVDAGVAFVDLTQHGQEDAKGARRPHLGWTTAVSAIPVQLTFTDAAGRRWQRAADGPLTMLEQ